MTAHARPTRALLIVDVQRDFCEGGSLAVDGGSAVAAYITAYLRIGAAAYDHIVATRDHHVDPGEHFAEHHPDFSNSWPAHCVLGTAGAEFHPDLDLSHVEAVFDKGAYEAAYSGFEGSHDGVPLQQWLTDRGVGSVDIVGLATDYCVRSTALDAVRLGFTTRVIVGMTAGVAEQSTAAALVEFRAAGIKIA